MAQGRLPRSIFDFYDGGAEDESTLGHNRSAFERHRLSPRVLVDVAQRDLRTTIVGESAALPLALSLAWAPDARAHVLGPWLPADAQVTPVLLASPQVLAAKAREQAQLQRARGTEAGSAEWLLRMNQQQRRLRDPQERFAESTVTLERPVRLWGKAAMDALIAEREREVARIGYSDALHEASRQLLAQWFDALRAQLASTPVLALGFLGLVMGKVLYANLPAVLLGAWVGITIGMLTHLNGSWRK